MSDDRTILRVKAFEDLVDRIAHFESFTIAGRVYSADYLIPQLTVQAADILSETASAAAFALTWGLEAARARRYNAQVEAAYRAWRDRIWLELKATPDEATGKFPTEATADKLVRIQPDYGVWRGKMDDSQQAAEMAEAIYEAFKMKKDMVKAAGEIMKTEAGGTAYVVVEDARRTAGRQPEEMTNE